MNRLISMQNLHTHTSFSDGLNTAEEMVLAAMEKGFSALGFSEHAYTPYDGDCCIKKADIPGYFAEINRLKQKYEGQIDIFTAFECDSHYTTDKTGLDYTIGSAHYVYNEKNCEYLTIDYTPEIFEKAVNDVANGDIKRFVEIYFDDLTSFVHSYKPDIVGHMDLIRKLNCDGGYFDETSAWYLRIIEDAAEKIAKSGGIVEVNTGGMRRNKKLITPYPSTAILERLLELKVPIIISSDSHSTDSIDFWFDEALDMVRAIGYKSIKQLIKNGFVDVEI